MLAPLRAGFLTTSGEDGATTSIDSKYSNDDELHLDKHVSDLKGRYYYEKFNFSPLDAEKHIALAAFSGRSRRHAG